MKKIPKMSELVEIMWKKDISVSRIGNQHTLRRNGYLTLSWDKWLDDERWEEHSKFKEYIYFEIKVIKNEYCLSIEIDDDACFVDIRAVHKAAMYIAKKANTLVSYNKKKWIKQSDYKIIVRKYLDTSFEEAVEKSLLNK